MRDRTKNKQKAEEQRRLEMGEYPLGQGHAVLQDELAEVLKYQRDVNAYTVVTRGAGGNPSQPGGRQLQDVPRKIMDPGKIAPLPIGTVVVINWSLGFPYIDGVLPVNASRAVTESGPNSNPTIGGGKDSAAVAPDASAGYANAYYREPGMPVDAMEGDQLLVTPDGNIVGALRGGYSFMSGGPNSKAKVEVFGDRDLARIICENYELITGFGTLEVFNTEGRNGLSFRGGVDQLTEAGGEEEQWTFKLDVGETGDYFTMEIADQAGNTKSKVNITAGGQVNIIATDGYNTTNAGTATSHDEHAGDMVRKILGKVVSVVGQSVDESMMSRSTAISETDQKSVGHNESTSINNSQILSIGGNQENTITGGPVLSAKSTNIAVNTQILNGSYFLEMGNPLGGANPSAMAGITLAVNNGDITLGQNPDFLALPASKANVSLNTRLPGSVALGGSTDIISTNPALFHAVMFEPLMALLTGWGAMQDTHIHPAPWLPPLVPVSPVIASLLPTLMSLRVLIGG